MEVVMKFVSEKTEGEAYDLFIKELKEAIIVNAYNEAKLENIRQDLINCRALVDNFQYRIKQSKDEQRLKNLVTVTPH